jgi:beta-glucosidase/6-phospho-beta-glucosidase/beta-galactosidase
MFMWFAEPLWLGYYPHEMRMRLGSRLPQFTQPERTLVNGSADFLGLNMYTGFYAENRHNPEDYGKPNGTTPSYWMDSQHKTITVQGARASASSWLTNVPWAMHRLLMFITKRYGRPPVYITENGWSTKGKQTAATGTDDWDRIDYYSGHIAQVLHAITDGADVRGYFAWSLLDNFEWQQGYHERFGIVHVDFATQKRTPKQSSKWYSRIVAANSLADHPDEQLDQSERSQRTQGWHESSSEGNASRSLESSSEGNASRSLEKQAAQQG